MNQYRNLPMDVADASLVILAEHLGHGRILSVDQRDFNAYRWKNTQPFQNLLVNLVLRVLTAVNSPFRRRDDEGDRDVG
jgi:hypothetical protein